MLFSTIYSFENLYNLTYQLPVEILLSLLST